MMKLFKTCPILIGIVAITIVLSVLSYAFEGTAYKQYLEGYDVGRLPHFVLVFKGASDKVYPWTKAETGMESLVEEKIASETADGGYDESDLLTVGDVSGNSSFDYTISGNDISGNSISDNDADKTYELVAVDEEYFSDALFIGDSRTVGLSEYCAPLDERAVFYAKVSLTIYGVLDKPFLEEGSEKISIREALEDKEFGKIYIMLGLNEIGTGTAETFAAEYQNVVSELRELQPDAIIYIQGIMHVTENKSSGDKYFNNDNINERNEALSQLADNKTVFYLDMNEAVDDENGNLIKELSFDDVHLKASSYERWYQYLLEHGIVRD